MTEPNLTQTREGLDHIEPIRDDWVAQVLNPGGVSNNKINEIIEKVNLIIDILNERLSYE
jgi:hypothetical protein